MFAFVVPVTKKTVGFILEYQEIFRFLSDHGLTIAQINCVCGYCRDNLTTLKREHCWIMANGYDPERYETRTK